MTRREIVNVDDEVCEEFQLFEAILENCKERLNAWDAWDALDPISWAILRVVQSHSHYTQAVRRALEEGHNPPLEAFEQRRKDVAALQDALERPAKSTDELPF